MRDLMMLSSFVKTPPAWTGPLVDDIAFAQCLLHADRRSQRQYWNKADGSA
jgi:hypothetical protein